MTDRGSEGVPGASATPEATANAAGGSPVIERSVLLELALYALRESHTREELLDHAARITAAVMGGDLAKVLEHVPPGASDFLTTAGAGWTAAESVVGVLRIPGGRDASPTGRAEATGRAQHSSSVGDDATRRLPEELRRAGVRSALDVSIPRGGETDAGSHGVLQADSRQARTFGAAEEALLQQIAAVLGAALDAEDRRRAAAEAAAAMQALLRAEADHRIANSLQGVAATLVLQARLADEDPRVAQPLRAAAARIAAAAAVHRHLYRALAAGAGSDGAATLDAAVLLHALCPDLAAMLSGLTGESERRLLCEAAPLPWPAARAAAIATIAAELAINAAKHAGGGTIVLRLAAGADGDALLSCDDEGPGFVPGFDPSQAPGLGLRLIRTLAGAGDDRVTAEGGAAGGRVRVRIARAAS